MALIAAGLLGRFIPQLFQHGKLNNSDPIVEILEEEFPESSIHEDILDHQKIVFVHNGSSEQCKRAERFIKNILEDHATYTLHTYIIQQDGPENYLKKLDDNEDECWLDTSLTDRWKVFPTLFVKEDVFVGYGPATRRSINQILNNDK